MKRNVHVICLQAIAFARTTTTSTTKQSDVRAEQVASCRSKEVLVCEGRYLMANNLFRFGSRRLLPSLRCLVHPHLRMKSESAKEAFQKIFPRMGASRLKPRYDANSYGQTVGPEYPFDIEKTPEGKIKREKSKGTMGSVSVEEIVEILRANGGENIKVAKLHQDLHYADHFIVVSGKDTEHLKKMTQNLATKVLKVGL